MDDDTRGGLTRRDFVRVVGAGAGAAAVSAPRPARAQRRTLRIAQWTHFVPEYDKWFDGVLTKAWGEKHDTRVIVDHISANEIPARAAAEVAAKKGHDLFMFFAPPAAYEAMTVDLSNVYAEVERKHGKKVALAHRSTYNPRSRRYFAFSDSYVPDLGNWPKELWTEAGHPAGPDSWEELRAGAKQIRERRGVPCGIGLSQEPDSSMAVRALLWSFGGAEQDEDGQVTLRSPQTLEALKFMKALHGESQTAEVFSWDPASNNRAMLAGKTSYVMNAISVTRTAEREQSPRSSQIMVGRPPKGPVRRMAAEHFMSCYVVWSFAENKEGAQRFLIDYIDASREALVASRLYNMPCFPGAVADLPALLADDPLAAPRDKYRVLGEALDWTANVGYPGYASAGIDEALRTWILPTLFARVARGDETPENALAAAHKEYQRIFARWK